jgi:hypothetical protein
MKNELELDEIRLCEQEPGTMFRITMRLSDCAAAAVSRAEIAFMAKDGDVGLWRVAGSGLNAKIDFWGCIRQGLKLYLYSPFDSSLVELPSVHHIHAIDSWNGVSAKQIIKRANDDFDNRVEKIIRVSFPEIKKDTVREAAGAFKNASGRVAVVRALAAAEKSGLFSDALLSLGWYWQMIWSSQPASIAGDPYWRGNDKHWADFYHKLGLTYHE